MERKRIGRRRGKTDEVHLNSEEFMYHVNFSVIKPSMAPSKEPYNLMFHKWPSVISTQDSRVQGNKIAHSQQIKKSTPTERETRLSLVWSSQNTFNNREEIYTDSWVGKDKM